jgi:hypothetical protein
MEVTMKKVFTLMAAVTMAAAVITVGSVQGFEEELWGGNYESPAGFEITNVEIIPIQCTHDHSQKAIAQAVPGTLVEDGWTTTVGSPNDEHYSFSGGGSAQVRHVVRFCEGGGSYPMEVCFAFAWQPCGHGVVFPPIPRLKGTLMDGERICMEISFSGCFEIAVTATGFGIDTWDWIIMANYDGSGPIHPLASDTDTFGGSTNSLVLYDVGDGVGHGLSAGRPWCFEVNP